MSSKISKECETCGKVFTRYKSQMNGAKFCSRKCLRFTHTEEAKRKISMNHRRHQSPETRRKISKIKKSKVNWNYKGGVSSENKKARKSVDFKLWREEVFRRDRWECQTCDKKPGDGKRHTLHPHHIYNFAEHVTDRFIPMNGITMCKECHNEFHKMFGLQGNNMAQIHEFISLK